MRSESREEKVEQQNTQVQARENDENGNKDRRNSTAEDSDQDACITEKQQSLQTIKDRSTQASPSNVCIEENEQTRQHSGNEQTRFHSGDEQTRGNSEDEQIRGNSGNEQIRVHSGKDDETLGENAGEMDRSGKPKKNEDVLIVHNSYTSQDQTVEKPENDFKDVTTIANDDSAAMTHEHSTTHDENLNKITNSDGSEPIRDTTKIVNYLGSDTEPLKVADNFNEEHTSLQANEAAEDSQQQQQQQNHIERGENAANGSEQSQTVVKGSTDQDPETMESSRANVTQSNDDEKVTTENEKIDQLRETTLG